MSPENRRHLAGITQPSVKFGGPQDGQQPKGDHAHPAAAVGAGSEVHGLPGRVTHPRHPAKMGGCGTMDQRAGARSSSDDMGGRRAD